MKRVYKMSDHYYSKQPHSQLKTDQIECTLRNHTFTFTTASGVFSKRSVDFGSQLLIETFQEPEVSGSILDLGCGYGPIGISLAKTFKDRTILMVDINERAISLTKQNIAQNNVDNAKALLSEGFANVEESNFAAIVTNPPIRAGKKIVYPMIEESQSRLQLGGELWVVIQKKQGAPSFHRFLSTLFSKVTVENRRKGYYIFRAVKEDN